MPDGYALASIAIDEPGTLDAPKRLATLTVSPRLPPGAVSGNQSVYFDPILNAPPWPLDADDNLNRRMDALLTIVRTFIEVLEESLDTEESSGRLEGLDGPNRHQLAANLHAAKRLRKVPHVEPHESVSCEWLQVTKHVDLVGS